MSLITQPRHRLILFPAKQEFDIDGGIKTSYGAPVQVFVNMHPVAADNLNRAATTREEYYGTLLETSYQITTPPGVWVYPIDSLALWNPQEYLPGAAHPAYSPGEQGKLVPTDALPSLDDPDVAVLTVRSREVRFRFTPRTEHDKVVLGRGADIDVEGIRGYWQ